MWLIVEGVGLLWSEVIYMIFVVQSTFAMIINFRWLTAYNLNIQGGMETAELQRYQQVQAFLSFVKNSNSRQDFMGKVQQFDNRFTEDYSAPQVFQRQKSAQKIPVVQKQPPRNPFKTQFEEHHPAQTQINPFAQNNKVRGHFGGVVQQNHARTDQQFYRPPSNPTPRNDYPPNRGIGLTNYNSFTQKQYDQLKDQFFRPPNVPKPESYPVSPSPAGYGQVYAAGNIRNNYDNAFNFVQMGMGLGMSSSQQLLQIDSMRGRPHQRSSFGRP